MTENKNNPQTIGRDASPEPAVLKKCYEPPRVVSRNGLEVITGLCTPDPPAKQSAAHQTCISGFQS